MFDKVIDKDEEVAFSCKAYKIDKYNKVDIDKLIRVFCLLLRLTIIDLYGFCLLTTITIYEVDVEALKIMLE